MADRRDTNHKWYSSFDLKRMTLTIEDGEGGELLIPAKYEVCTTCEGRGTHVNPSIDSNGLTAEDFEQDPDFREDYFSGRYDQPCNECHGERVVPTIDEDRCDVPTLQKARQHIEDHYAYERECEAERRMGA